MDSLMSPVSWFETKEQEGLYELAARNAEINAIAVETLRLIRDMDTAHCFRDTRRRDTILERQAELSKRLEELNRA